MKKVLVILLSVLSAAIVVILGLAAQRNGNYQIERSIEIAAPAATVFGIAADFRQFEKWSPWEKHDPNMKKTYSGTPAAVGSIYEWNGNSEVGEGRMTITELVPDQLIRVKLEFVKPFADTSETIWTTLQTGGKTTMTWTMKGKHEKLMLKVFGLLMNMEKMLGADFEQGLANLKGVAESASPSPSPSPEAVPEGGPASQGNAPVPVP